MNVICLVAGLLMVPLGEAITLQWTHSVQKTLWEEDYQLAGERLLLTSARVRATGAGMEPPPDAVFHDGAWHYRPMLPPLPSVQMRHSPYVAPYTVCHGTDCRTPAAWLPGLPEESILELRPCDKNAANPPSTAKVVTMRP